MPLRVLHIITGLNVGGAEGMLLKLVAAQRLMQIESEVISLSDMGVIGEQIQKLGFEVHALNVSDFRRAAGALTRVLRVTDTMRPSVIQTWLPHADFVG